MTVQPKRQVDQWCNVGKGVGKGHASTKLLIAGEIGIAFVEANVTVTIKNSKYTQHLMQQIPLLRK